MITLKERDNLENEKIKELLSPEERENVRSNWCFQTQLFELYGDSCFMEQHDIDRLRRKWTDYINIIFGTRCQTDAQAQYVYDAWKYKSQVSKVYHILGNKGIDRYISPKDRNLSEADINDMIKKIARIIEL